MEGEVERAAPRIYGVKYGEEVSLSLPIGEGIWVADASAEFFFILGSRNAYFGAFSGPLEYLLASAV